MSNAGPRTRVVRAQIDEVRNIDCIRTDRQRLEAPREAMAHLAEHAVDCQCEVERSDADRVEPPPMDGGAVAR